MFSNITGQQLHIMTPGSCMKTNHHLPSAIPTHCACASFKNEKCWRKLVICFIMLSYLIPVAFIIIQRGIFYIKHSTDLSAFSLSLSHSPAREAFPSPSCQDTHTKATVIHSRQQIIYFFFSFPIKYA